MIDLDDVIKKLNEFREARDWKQFHNAKDMALYLSLESAEVLEHFAWKNGKEVEEYVKAHKDEIGQELADVLYWVLLLSDDMGLDVFEALEKKMKQNEVKYPIEKAKGKHAKYTEL